VGKRNRNKKQQQNPEKDVSPLQAGDRLRLARESRDLSVEDVATRLKLDTGKIKALEQGDISGFAASVFAAGYLRTYARLLELPEAEVLADFDELVSVHEQVIDPVSTVNKGTYGKMASGVSSQFSLRDKSSGKHLGKAGIAGVFIVGLVYFLWPVSESEHTGVIDAVSPDASTSLTGKTIEIAVPAPEAMTEETVSDTQVVDVQNPAASNVVEAGQSERVLPETSAEPVATPEAGVEALAPGQGSELVLIFNSDSWAEVQDARDQRLVYHLGKSGTRRVVRGIAPFRVQLGYVQGVDILYNGAPYDLSKYANRRSVRLRIGTAGEHMDGE